MRKFWRILPILLLTHAGTGKTASDNEPPVKRPRFNLDEHDYAMVQSSTSISPFIGPILHEPSSPAPEDPSAPAIRVEVQPNRLIVRVRQNPCPTASRDEPTPLANMRMEDKPPNQSIPLSSIGKIDHVLKQAVVNAYPYFSQFSSNPVTATAAAFNLNRTSFLIEIRRYRSENKSIIYLDETWFNCNDVPDCIWQDSTIEQNLRLARQPGSDLTYGLQSASGRGKRLIIVNAIERSGPVNNALWVFASKSPVMAADYHKEMDSHNFEKWFKERLLPNLKPGSVIVMDNAPYHSRKESSVQSSMRKSDLFSRLTDMGFFTFLANKTTNFPSDPARLTKVKMMEYWMQYRGYFEYNAVDRMATDAGHTVLRLPPYHCVFNPIELLWGYQKRKARNCGGPTRRISNATEICNWAFNEIPSDDLGKYFDHTIAEENKYWTLGDTDTVNRRHPPVIFEIDSSESSSESDEM